MTDYRVNVYATYLAAWSAISDEDRLRMLRDSVTDAIRFKNPLKTRNGMIELVEHLEGFQVRSPGGSFRFLAMLGWENNAMATWQFVDAERTPGFSGYDVLAFDEGHQIDSIVLFGNVEKQTLK